MGTVVWFALRELLTQYKGILEDEAKSPPPTETRKMVILQFSEYNGNGEQSNLFAYLSDGCESVYERIT